MLFSKVLARTLAGLLLCLVQGSPILVSLCCDAETITLDPICEAPAARNPPLPPGNPAPSTRRMAQLLAKLGEDPGPGALSFMNDRMVSLLEDKLSHATNIVEKLKDRFELGIQQIRAGSPDHALNTFAALEQAVAEDGVIINQQQALLSGAMGVTIRSRGLVEFHS